VCVFFFSSSFIIFFSLSRCSCWDWYGYTGQDYANKDGVQMKFLFNLLTALGAKYSDHSVGGEEL
jgi:hypothetical protein